MLTGIQSMIPMKPGVTSTFMGARFLVVELGATGALKEMNLRRKTGHTKKRNYAFDGIIP
jgi:hypothetical protein